MKDDRCKYLFHYFVTHLFSSEYFFHLLDDVGSRIFLIWNINIKKEPFYMGKHFLIHNLCVTLRPYFGYKYHIYGKSGLGKIRDHCLFRDPKAHYFICWSVHSSFVYFQQSDVIQKIPAIGCRYLIWSLWRIYNLR